MPIRVLHVMNAMNQGGAETWRMQMLRRTDRRQFEWDFLVHTTEKCAYDDEIRALGARLIPCMHPTKPLQYASNFRRIVTEHGPYDVVHSGVHHFGGYVLRLAAHSGIPGRIVHSHNQLPGDGSGQAFMRPTYLRLMKHWIRRYATAGLAVSTPAADAFFGREWQRDPRWRIHYHSRDLTPFAERVNRAQVRKELGIAKDAVVVGHVGRFDPVKNHEYLVKITHELIRCRPETHVLLVGSGPLKPDIEKQVQAHGLQSHFTFAGEREDVPRLMRGAMDCFLLPSLYDGLPGVAIEAQAAGLPLLMSDEIAVEAIIPYAITERLSLTRSPAVWANTIVRLTNGPRLTPADALAAVVDSPFNIDRAHHALEDLYRTLAAPQGLQLIPEAA